MHILEALVHLNAHLDLGGNGLFAQYIGEFGCNLLEIHPGNRTIGLVGQPAQHGGVAGLALDGNYRKRKALALRNVHHCLVVALGLLDAGFSVQSSQTNVGQSVRAEQNRGAGLPLGGQTEGGG